MGDAEEANPERDGRDMGTVETVFAPEGPDIFVDSNHDSLKSGLCCIGSKTMS